MTPVGGSAPPLQSLPWRYRVVLGLLPAHVRDEHGRELAMALTDEAAPGTMASWHATCLDVLRAAPRAHWDVLRQDLRLAARQVRRSPAFAVMAMLTLSIGLGGNLAFFTLVDGVLLRPLRYAGQDRLLDVTEENLPEGRRNFGVSPADFLDLTRDPALFEAAAAFQVRSGTLRAGESFQRVQVASVSGDFFRVFRERPLLGRTLEAPDDVVGGNAAVVSETFFTTVLGGDPSALGREIEYEHTPLRVVGVMPRRFDFPSPTVAMWTPLAMPPSEWERRGARFVSVVARTRRGVSVEAVASRLDAVSASLAVAYPASNTGWTVRVRLLRDALVDDARSSLYLMAAAGALLLLIAVANVANLFLSRALTRQREMALRSALGARAGRVVRQLATEAMLLVAGGAAAGLAIAGLVVAWIRRSAGGAIPRLDEVAVDGRTAVAAIVAGVLTAVVIGALSAPARHARDLWNALGSGRAGATPERRRLQRGLVVGEVALAVFVLAGASLVVRTLLMVINQPLGFAPHQRLTFRIEPPMHVQPGGPMAEALPRLRADQARASEGYAALLTEIERLPGVRRAGAVNRLPLSGEYWITGVGIPGHPAPSADGSYATYVRPVTPGYFEAMGTRIVRGRAPGRDDVAGAEPVVVIDETFARRVWGAADPVGRALMLEGPARTSIRARVVGVAEAVHMGRLDSDVGPAMYVPFAQALEGMGFNWGMDVVVDGASPGRDVEAIARLARGVFPDAVLFNVTTMDDRIAASLAPRRFQLLMLGLVAVLALVLATVGVGGALLLAVREQRGEFAVRMALGARGSRVWWQVQRGGLRLAASGAVIGLAAAVAGARAFSSLVYGVSVRDPLALGAGPVLVCLAAFVAVAIPATRAVRVSPIAVLRDS